MNWWRELWGTTTGAGEAAVHCRDEDGIRRLYLGSRTVQSAMRLDDPVHLELAYTRAMLATLLFRPEPHSALLIGLGGGSLVKFLHHRLPGCRLEAIESDPAVLSIARSHFALPPDDERLRTTIGDGAALLAERAGDAQRYAVDLMLVDAFDGSRQVAGCATPAFFRSAAAVLTRDGVCAVNFWSNTPEFPVYRDRFLDAFSGRMLLMPLSRPGNMIGFGFASSDGDWLWSSLRARAKQLEACYRLEFGRFVEALRSANPYTETRLLI